VHASFNVKKKNNKFFFISLGKHPKVMKLFSQGKNHLLVLCATYHCKTFSRSGDTNIHEKSTHRQAFNRHCLKWLKAANFSIMPSHKFALIAKLTNKLKHSLTDKMIGKLTNKFKHSLTDKIHIENIQFG
jgi:hypothetical protein